MEVGNLDRRQLLALLGEYLDARIKTYRVKRIVGNFLDVQIDRRRSRSFGVFGHLEFFRRRLLKLRVQQRRR